MDFSKLLSDTKRFQTAAVLLLIVALVGFFHNFFVIFLFLTVIFAFALHEALGLYKLKSSTWIYTAAGLLWIAAAFYPKPEDLTFLGLIVLASLIAFRQSFDIRIILPLMYPVVPMLFLLSLYREFGIQAYVLLLFIVAAADTGAYFTGKAIGKTSFSPSSPNKTLEGVAGGVLLATILGSIVASLFDLAIYQAILISFVVSIASVFGDLYESFLKREAGVKDSGTILPGHGGVLDRVDGYLFAGIVLVLMLRFFA